jgi:hypothetical protein
MSIIVRTAIATILFGFAATGAAQARSGHGGYAAQYGHIGPPIGYVPQNPVMPQFNNPGPQISIPHPSNPVDQLPPLMGAGQPDALGIK